MGYETAISVIFVGAALISFLIGDSFKTEDQKWYGLLFRCIFYMFSIGFIALGIGAQQQFIQETGIVNSYLNNTITGGVSLVTNMNYFFILTVLVLTITAIIYNVLQLKQRKGNPYDRQ